MAVLAGQATAQTADDQIKVARSSLKADRKATVAAAMQFTEAEGKGFWPSTSHIGRKWKTGRRFAQTGQGVRRSSIRMFLRIGPK